MVVPAAISQLSVTPSHEVKSAVLRHINIFNWPLCTNRFPVQLLMKGVRTKWDVVDPVALIPKTCNGMQQPEKCSLTHKAVDNSMHVDKEHGTARSSPLDRISATLKISV